MFRFGKAREFKDLLRISAFIKLSPDALEQSNSINLSFAVLKPRTDFSFLEMKILFGILFQNRAGSSALNTCSGLYRSSDIMLQMQLLQQLKWYAMIVAL